MKPNYSNFGLSEPMSKELRKLIENQLTYDLTFYGVEVENLKFDWSKSCIEGHLSNYLKSSVENYSEISVYDSSDNIVAEGWMEYVNEAEFKVDGTFFIAYWDYLTIWKNNKIVFDRKESGIPEHVLNHLPTHLKMRHS